jgi:hypothetical protein
MHQADGNYIYLPDGKRIGGDFMHPHPRDPGVLFFSKHVGKTDVKGPEHPCLGIYVHGTLLQIVEGPDIIQSRDMVPVLVRKQDRMQPGGTRPEHLLPEIGARIDDHHFLPLFHKYGGTQAFITFIRRHADCTTAPDHRDTLGSTGTQKSNFQTPWNCITLFTKL